MFIYLSKKIAIPNGVKQRVVSWNGEHGWIACGGENGLLKVLKLEATDPRAGVNAPTTLTMNQTLDGHGGAVVVATWNEHNKKLTTSDESGLIIVWMLHKGMWFEEMINNRNESVVRDMKWTADGQKICIVYEDGAVIVGSVDGNRLWGKQLKSRLKLVEWSPDARYILFVTYDGVIQIYDNMGNAISKVPLIDSVAGQQIVAIAWYDGVEIPDPNAPMLAICFSGNRGVVHLLTHEMDERPAILETGIKLRACKWSPTGQVFAVTGSIEGLNDKGEQKENHLVMFYNAWGEHMARLKVPGGGIHGLSWEGTGLRLSLAVDSFVYFANVRPDYKWGFFGDTVVYAFNKPDRPEHCVIFWNTKTGDKHTKYVKKLLKVCACGESCILLTKSDDASEQYILIVCNAIGSPINSKYLDFEPTHLAMSEQHVVASSAQIVYIWQYASKMTSKVPSDSAMHQLRRKDGRERQFHIDDIPSQAMCDTTQLMERGNTNDPVCAVGVSDHLVLVARQSGMVHRYSLPHVALEGKFSVNCHASKLAINCNSTRMGCIDASGIMSLWSFVAEDPAQQAKNTAEKLPLERKDAWDVLWSADEPDMFTMLEKARMYVFRGLTPEEPVTSSSYLCHFSDLQVTAVQLDELLQDPEHPSRDLVTEYETRGLRDTRAIIAENIVIHEAYQFVEQNAHPRLWRLIAEAALERLDFTIADKAFVQCSDYQGIQFVKRLRGLGNKTLQRAEVETYFKRFDEAEKAFHAMDRMDLALEMRKRLGDWFRVVQMVTQGYGDDRDHQLALNQIGDYYADRQKWNKAAQFYSQAKNNSKLAVCLYMLEDFVGLEQLTQALPPGPESYELLKEIGDKFTSVGMVAEAEGAFIRAGEPRMAIDACASLNEWDQAVKLAQEHADPAHIEELLARYARHLLEKGDKFEAMTLYRKAHKHTKSAQLLADLAEESANTRVNPMRTKKLYVLCALELEELQKRAMGGAGSTLDRLLDQDHALVGTTKELGWRGAEAYHFYMLAQRQLFEGSPQQIEAAMRTALRLRVYEDILPAKEIYSLIALTAYYNKSFAQCSKAFIKLESLPDTEADASTRERYETLAMAIFVPNQPVDLTATRRQCPECRSHVEEWAEKCTSDVCNKRFSMCVATGRSILDESYVTCQTCRHAILTDAIRHYSCLLYTSPSPRDS
eukprot:TRINITY_DN4596_c0_g6_i3.p1 TRINITY_DN4596_c0_g6~~TRINITY_DN4596_c0_g6_i3.p1  ORF type:complete len:1179 (-),score=268.48 TRINITY_DN4596_c0_g6_i3:50-3586(-)